MLNIFSENEPFPFQIYSFFNENKTISLIFEA